MGERLKIGIEIEKKYVIRKPALSILSKQSGYTASEIVQIYISEDSGATHRIRRRSDESGVCFTETKKIRIDEISSKEIEREISREEFDALSANILATTRPIIKQRHTFIYKSQLFEIDVYPEWEHTAIMETELDSRERVVEMPDFIEIIKDVTGDKSYSNRAMSQVFPEEQLS